MTIDGRQGCLGWGIFGLPVWSAVIMSMHIRTITVVISEKATHCAYLCQAHSSILLWPSVPDCCTLLTQLIIIIIYLNITGAKWHLNNPPNPYIYTVCCPKTTFDHSPWRCIQAHKMPGKDTQWFISFRQFEQIMWRDILSKEREWTHTTFTQERPSNASHFLSLTVLFLFLNLTKHNRSFTRPNHQVFVPKLNLNNGDLVRQDKKQGVKAFAHRLQPLKGRLSTSALNTKGSALRYRRPNPSAGDTNGVHCNSWYDAKEVWPNCSMWRAGMRTCWILWRTEARVETVTVGFVSRGWFHKDRPS